MNYAIYIAAAAVMALLIGLVVLSISWLQKTVLRSIRSKTMGLLSAYDELLEEKSRELNAMQAPQAPAPEESPAQRPQEQSQDARQLSEAMLSSIQRSGTVPYRDAAVGGIYRVIRENFSYAPEDILPAIRQASQVQEGPATSLLKRLDYDSVYQLSTLDGGDQRAILESILEGEAAALLADYAEKTRHFSAMGFYDHLESLAASEPGPARLRVAPAAAQSFAGTGIQVIADPQICEGYQIEQDNRLYDFSIKTRELS